MGTLGLAITWLLSYFINYKTKFKELIVLTVWFLGPIIISSEFSKTMTARYVFFSLPYFVLIAASVILTKNKLLSRVSYLLLALFVVQSVIYNFKLLNAPEKANLPRSERSGYLEEWTAGQGIREISMFLKEESLKSEKNIVVGTEGFFGTLPDGLQIYFDKDQKVNVIGIGLQLEKVPDQLIESKKAGNKTYLVVNDERLHMNYEENSLKLIKEYPKAVRPDGSHQSLMLFEVTDEAILNY